MRYSARYWSLIISVSHNILSDYGVFTPSWHNAHHLRTSYFSSFFHTFTLYVEDRYIYGGKHRCSYMTAADIYTFLILSKRTCAHQSFVNDCRAINCCYWWFGPETKRNYPSCRHHQCAVDMRTTDRPLKGAQFESIILLLQQPPSRILVF